MAGRTEAEAVRAFIEPLQLAVSCVTRDVCTVSGGYAVAADPHALVLARGEPVPLQGSNDLRLSLKQNYRILESEGPRGPWKVSTTAYSYAVFCGDDELVAFQWHPQSRVTRPHVHIGAGADVGYAPLTKAHLPTGRIAVEDVLRLLIEDLGAEPIREDWEEVLDSTQGGFEAWRTWPSPGAEPAGE